MMSLNPDKLSYYKGASGNRLTLADFANLGNNSFLHSRRKSMSRFNVETLMALANIKNDDEFAKYDALPSNLQEVLKRKLKEQEEKRLEDAADSIVLILSQTDDAIAARVDRIRELRRSVERLKAEIGEIERTKAFGMETQNFVPLAASLGMVSLMAKGAVIPTEWTAKDVTKKAAVKK
jgi:vacuolar-type H+-ATPase subunit I/STV1